MACRFCREDDERQKCEKCGIEVCHACWIPNEESSAEKWAVKCSTCARPKEIKQEKPREGNAFKKLGDAKLLDIMRSKTSSAWEREDASKELTRRMKNREAKREAKKAQGDLWARR